MVPAVSQSRHFQYSTAVRDRSRTALASNFSNLPKKRRSCCVAVFRT